jgi:hypothetical protein
MCIYVCIYMDIYNGMGEIYKAMAEDMSGLEEH